MLTHTQPSSRRLQKSPGPLLDASARMVVAALLFFLGCALLAGWMHQRRIAGGAGPVQQRGQP